MNRNLSLKVILGLLLLFPLTAVSAQETTISPEKRKVISEIISILKADQQVEQTVRAFFSQMDANYPQMTEAILAGRKDLTDADKEFVRSSIMAENRRTNNFQTRLLAEVNFSDYVEKLFYPLYDKFFTESELKDLLTFYNSPTGKKLNQVTPQLLAESIKISQQVLLPQMIELSNKLIKEDIETAAKPRRKPGK